MKPLLIAPLAALALAACATAAPPAPQEPASISLTRSVCFGFCPDYTVTIESDGDVIYVGRNFVGVTGEQRDHISPEAARALFDMAHAADFYALRDVYRANITDLPTFTVTLTEGDRTKRVVDYAGESVGMPRAVRDLEEAIDRAANTARWTARGAGPGGPRKP